MKTDPDVPELQTDTSAVALRLQSASVRARGWPLGSGCTAGLMSREIEAAESRSAGPPAN